MDGKDLRPDESEYEEARKLRIALKIYDIKTIYEFLPRIASMFIDDAFMRLVQLVFAKNPEAAWEIIGVYFAYRIRMARKKETEC
ncbi:MAG: hypothetical protein U9P90_04400 [Patescibacteria group bacterium]|nr:hypothetical protein [Patescibacteria group bacterium]